MNNLSKFDNWLRPSNNRKNPNLVTTANINRPNMFYCIELVEYWHCKEDEQENSNNNMEKLDGSHEVIFKAFTEIKNIQKVLATMVVNMLDNYFLISDNRYELKIYYPSESNEFGRQPDARAVFIPGASSTDYAHYMAQVNSIMNTLFPPMTIEDRKKRKEITPNELHSLFACYKSKI